MKSKIPAGLTSLLYQNYETELGGLKIYQAAIDNAQNSDLKDEWEKYLSETRTHVEVAHSLLEAFGLDPDADVPARKPVSIIGEALVSAMKTARKEATKAEAELVAAECVVLAETKDHMNWEMIKAACEEHDDLPADLQEKLKEVETQEDHHLYHTKGFARELWYKAIGQQAVLPPPEEIKHVESAIGAERAKNAREKMM